MNTAGATRFPHRPLLGAPAAPPAEVGTPDDDARLAARAIGDSDAYAALYQRYADSVYRYMLAKVGNRQDAQDLTAQTFLAGLEAIRTFQGRGSFCAWLFGIARRKAMDYFRRSPRTLPLDDIAEVAHPGQQPDEWMEQQFDYAQLASAIRSLAPDRAEALVLRVFAELPIAHIAASMNRSECAVRMLLSRAMHDLKQRMARKDQPPSGVHPQESV